MQSIFCKMLGTYMASHGFIDYLDNMIDDNAREADREYENIQKKLEALVNCEKAHELIRSLGDASTNIYTTVGTELYKNGLMDGIKFALELEKGIDIKLLNNEIKRNVDFNFSEMEIAIKIGMGA